MNAKTGEITISIEEYPDDVQSVPKKTEIQLLKEALIKKGVLSDSDLNATVE